MFCWMVAGGSKSKVNKEGIAYYNNLIYGLLRKVLQVLGIYVCFMIAILWLSVITVKSVKLF